MTISSNDLEKKYNLAYDARNLFVSASQSVYAALHYLPHIEVPYCRPEEMLVMDKAIAYIFLDMMSKERHDHALNCYQTTLKRVGALKQWLSQVISTTISRDLMEVLENSRIKSTELRNERVKLIKQRLKELLGRDSHDLIQDTPIDLRDSGFDSELEESIGTDELRRLFSSEKSSGSTPDPTPRPLVMPTPVPSADLAPMPSTDEIFGKFFELRETIPSNTFLSVSGKIEYLRQRHKKELSELSQNQRLAQAKMSQGLRDKLNQRRSRRSRLDMHSRQQEALNAFSQN